MIRNFGIPVCLKARYAVAISHTAAYISKYKATIGHLRRVAHSNRKIKTSSYFEVGDLGRKCRTRVIFRRKHSKNCVLLNTGSTFALSRCIPAFSRAANRTVLVVRLTIFSMINENVAKYRASKNFRELSVEILRQIALERYRSENVGDAQSLHARAPPSLI